MDLAIEGTEELMSGVHSLSWYPTGKKTMARILYWLGFRDIRLIVEKEQNKRLRNGRIELMAAREDGRLDNIPDKYIRIRPERAFDHKPEKPPNISHN